MVDRAPLCVRSDALSEFGFATGCEAAALPAVTVPFSCLGYAHCAASAWESERPANLILPTDFHDWAQLNFSWLL